MRTKRTFTFKKIKPKAAMKVHTNLGISSLWAEGRSDDKCCRKKAVQHQTEELNLKKEAGKKILGNNLKLSADDFLKPNHG